jgi:soluble lytic murein transglycosylase-like protein
MNPVQKAIVPGILIGVFTLVGLSRLVTPPLTVSAATEEVQNVAEQEKQSSCEFHERYPANILPWCALIEVTADKYNMDALLIAAVMLQESGGQPEVISGSGAVGLMQVMPRDGIAATFQCINGPCFTNRPSIAELKDPAFNVDYGVRMLAGLTERHGDIREALKSYGPYDVGYQYADKVLTIRGGL